MGVDTTRLGELGANTEEYMSLRLKIQLDVLPVFAAFIVFAPRGVERGRGTENYVKYAE